MEGMYLLAVNPNTSSFSPIMQFDLHTL